jgi:hypothetical protein
LSRLEHPEIPVAVLLNANTEDPSEVEQLRATVKRILARAAPEGWYVAVAVPRLDAWAITDPRIRKDFESWMEGKGNYFHRAVRMPDLTRETPFDPTELLRSTPDLRGLVDFLRRRTPAAAPEARRGASHLKAKKGGRAVNSGFS